MRQFLNDIEAEAITLESEAARIEAAFDSDGDMSDDHRENAVRLYVEPRRKAAAKLREAHSAVRNLVPVGFTAKV
jgi:hypothetical protein